MAAPTPTQDTLNHAAPPRAAESERFLTLDGLRGIAAFAVILDHVSSATLQAWFPGRYLAVDFFFVLSGFVLAHAYGGRLEAGMSPWAFMRVRLIRLYPLYLLGLALGLILPILSVLRGWDDGPGSLSEIALIGLFAIAFLPSPPIYNWTGAHLYPFNGPAWSLFFELVANLVYGFVARFLTWRVFAIALPIGAALVAFTVMRHDTMGPGWLWPHFDAGLARVLYCFFAGVMIYKLRSAIRLPAMPAWMAVVALLAIFAVPAIGQWRQAYDAFAAILLMPLLVMFASGAKVSGAVAKVCATLGLLSYGVYAMHVPLMILIDFALDTAGVTLPYGFVQVLLVAGVSALAAWVAHHVYDMPVRRWLSGRAKAKSPQVPAGEAG